MRFVFISILFLLACAVNAPIAGAQAISRCQDKEGNIIYTDKSCEDVDAVPQNLPKPAGNIGYSVVRSCARTQEDLLWDLRGALETGDINRASGLFLWNGNDTAQSDKRLDQLNKISYHSLISVDLLFPEDEDYQVTFDEDGNIVEKQRQGPPVPYGIKVEFYTNKKQTDIGSIRFGIERHVECYWVRF